MAGGWNQMRCMISKPAGILLVLNIDNNKAGGKVPGSNWALKINVTEPECALICWRDYSDGHILDQMTELGLLWHFGAQDTWGLCSVLCLMWGFHLKLRLSLSTTLCRFPAFAFQTWQRKKNKNTWGKFCHYLWISEVLSVSLPAQPVSVGLLLKDKTTAISDW